MDFAASMQSIVVFAFGDRNKRNKMHIVGLILAAVAAAGVWYWRAKQASRVADQVIDTAGHLRGAFKRRNFRKKVEGSVLTSVDHPGLAAAILLISIAEGAKGWSDTKQAEIAEWLRDEVQYPDVGEALAYGRWVSREVVDGNEIVRKLLPVWQQKLTVDQKKELIDEATRVAQMEGGPDHSQTDSLRRLREGLMH